jgi:hypothetical protein
MWSYHQWFGYPFVTLLVWKWVHCNPLYIFKYYCNCHVGKWSSCTKRGFPPFPSPYTKMSRYYHHQRGFWTLVNIITTNSTLIYLIQCTLTMTTHVTIVAAQKNTQSYTKQTPWNDFIPLAIKTYGCFHLRFDSFFISCVHANIACHQQTSMVPSMFISYIDNEHW